ncbi:MAG: cobalamin B12-binding domain-containing protein [Actinobacteria bacterium]|nr:cobalamin B12-binding domain-containing protein [Actinomycetota bacterium]MBS1881888.1 cobalamin B12-binding domain-containing protein [Actinomycetota bacterium]
MAALEHTPKVLVAKVGLDGHDVGARVIARGLVDRGMEVVYTGIRRTPEQVVAAARDEDVDVIGISILSGAHMPLLTRTAAALREDGIDDVLLIVGGIIPDDDAAALREVGVDAVFHPESTIDAIADYITEALGGRSGADAQREVGR